MSRIFSFCAAQPEVQVPAALSGDSPNTHKASVVLADVETVILGSAAPGSESERVICVREIAVSSIIPRRVCYTQEQLESQAKRTQKWLSDELSQGGKVRDSAPIQ